MSTGHSCPRTARSQQHHILVSSDQEARGLCLGPAYGLNSIQLPSSAGPEQQTSKTPAMSRFSTGQKAFSLDSETVGLGRAMGLIVLMLGSSVPCH